MRRRALSIWALSAWLGIGGIAVAEVVVTGKAPIVDTKSTATAQTIDAQAFERLPTARNAFQLLLTLPGTVGGRPVDQANVAINGASLSGATSVYISPGWKWKPSGQGIQLNGPPAGAGGVKVGFNLPKVQRPQPYIDLQFYEKKQQLQKVRLPVYQLAPRQPVLEPKSAIVLPRRLAPGDRIEYRPLDPKFTPGGGEWKIGPWKPMWNGSYDRPSYQFELPKDFKLTPGFSLRVSYTSPWNETLVDGTLDGLTLASIPTTPSDAPSVRGCSPAVLDGDAFCVCGNFPPGSASELLINGAPVDQFLVASSPTILEYSFPLDAPTGVMQLGAGSGFDIADGARGVLIHVGGEIDRAKLRRGESTTLKLRLDGTDLATDLRLWNSTPAIVSLAGGDDQVVTTSGGSPNQVTRTVNAVSPGDFALHYQLTVDTCPCAEIAERLSPGESLPELGDSGAAGLAKGEQSKGGECTLEREARNENKETWFRCVKGASDTCSKSCELWRAAKSDGSDPEKVGNQDEWKQGYTRSSKYYCLCK